MFCVCTEYCENKYIFIICLVAIFCNVKVQNLYSELTSVYKSESTLRKHYLDTIAYFDSLSVCM